MEYLRKLLRKSGKRSGSDTGFAPCYSFRFTMFSSLLHICYVLSQLQQSKSPVD
ncbi:hypothetical protein DICVIV_14039 [Dictyocaulus viviparus]|uniref:Uncharacterized protein n=1 Tax=Dictyocaulus viviparus TaxID=29172 RepID=A0A0D8X8E0_DICVI|nr:hypothetical protein DICVIV_14039 [Dictyocaulus viviparus]